MKFKKLFLGFFIIILLITVFVSALTTTEIFFDGFEADNFATIWTSDAIYTRQAIASNTDGGGTFSIETEGAITDATMEITTAQNISNQTTCNLTSRILIESGLDGGEYICMDYSTDDGATWNRDSGSDGGIGGLCQDGNVDTENTFRTISYSFTPTGIQKFKFRFRATISAPNEDAYIDNVNLTCTQNIAPIISNITVSDTSIKGGNTITFYANTSTHGVNDSEGDSLTLYCDNTTTPTVANTDCTGGTTTDASYPYVLSCSFATPTDDVNHTEYCRVYDGNAYSSTVNISYLTDSTPPTTTVDSVAGDTTLSYFDTVDDSITEINVSGETNMNCRWSSSDVSYSAMTNDCTTIGSVANCSVNDVGSQGFFTRYVSCQDSLTNEQNSTQNLNVQFFLDYTAPTTSDNSVETVQVPNYTVTITESDNVDSDPTTLYCTDIANTCNPSISIDNGGTIIYTSSNRGINYLRYNSTDDANNQQITVSSTININQLPIFTNATDDATTIKGGTTVNITSISNDSDAGQELTMFVCDSISVNSSGCGGTNYCNATSSANMSCTFNSETDSAIHTWYAFVYDELDEAAITNFSGDYTTDTTAPTITINNPTNNSKITQDSVTFTMTLNEALTNGWYNLNDGTNITMTNASLLVYTHANLSIADGNYNATFYANDSYGNLASSKINFTIDATEPDTDPPIITIWSPTNNTYDIDGTVLLNITASENLEWAGWQNNSEIINTLDNYSSTNWNNTISFTEGQHNITFYANDSSNNQANETVTLYVDLNNPQVTSFSCTSPVNDSENVNCTANITDTIGLNYAIIGHNATGTWQNSSQLGLSGLSDTASYLIASGNTTPPKFTAQLYLYDLSGRTNFTESYTITINDDTAPIISNISYTPNTSAALDPGITISINASITEDYNISTVILMYQNISSGIWNSITMANNSAIVEESSSTIYYNASFTPQNGTWVFKINATDSAGNEQISSNISLEVIDDISHEITTNIPTIKSFTTSQAASNKSLGQLLMNNTGDGNLSFTVNLISTGLSERLSVNFTSLSNANFSNVTSGDLINITIDVNTTSLAAALYSYNISVTSAVGTTIYERYLNIQTVAAPELSVSIDTYSSTITAGQTNLELVATVENLGTLAATNVFLNWTLPSDFTLTSGSLYRDLGVLPIDDSGTNTITVSVSASATSGDVNLIAVTTSDNADSANDTKVVTISGAEEEEEEETPSTGGGTSGSVGGGSESVAFETGIEIVRGEDEVIFDISVTNTYENSTLENLVLELTGFPSQYIKTSPAMIDKIKYGETKSFTVTINAPIYKSYEENILTAIITGKLVTGTKEVNYREVQTIDLTIQAVSKEETIFSITEAEKALQEMIDAGFNVEEAKRLLIEANIKIESKRNKQAKDLADELTLLRDRAFEVDSLIRELMDVLTNPHKGSLLLTPGESNFLIENYATHSYFANHPAVELVNLAKVAFDRGDYELAKKRADSARSMILFSIKGNVWLFFLLYWPVILLGGLTLSIVGIFGFRKHHKSSINKKILGLNKKEFHIGNLIKTAQKNYFSGKIAATEYHHALYQHQRKLSSVKKLRIGLRNKRVKMLKPKEVSTELKSERSQIEEEIKKLQTDYYKKHKISKQRYKPEFDSLNKRLAEIEEEHITLSLTKNNKLEKIRNKNKKRIAKKENMQTKKRGSVKKIIQNIFGGKK